ncbi:MAG TPA: Gfo/Idh/MocA family oxidoreductase, partial [Gemmataceae bacterium]|nr:Gfo/Idh/MocA family oxidoreductase [Gemmataceae bacterium]
LLASVRDKYADVETTTNYDDLLRDPTVQGVVLATIAPTHHGMARRALEAGKHVLVEKPMTLTLADAHDLQAVAAARGRVLMVGHLMEYHPAIPAIKGLIDAGELGEVTRIESRRLNHGTLRTDENAWWSFAPHDVSIALRLMGEWPTSVHCDGQNIVQPHVADAVNGVLRFPGGRVARIDVSWHDMTKTRELKVFGTKKWVLFDDTLPWDRKVIVHDRGFDVAGPGRIGMRQKGETALALDQTDALVVEARHFVECVRTGARPLSDGESGAGVVAVLECGQRSLDERREVSVARPGGASLRAAA